MAKNVILVHTHGNQLTRIEVSEEVYAAAVNSVAQVSPCTFQGTDVKGRKFSIQVGPTMGCLRAEDVPVPDRRPYRGPSDGT